METTAIYEQALIRIACLCEVDSHIESIAFTALIENGAFRTKNESQLELFPEELLF